MAGSPHSSAPEKVTLATLRRMRRDGRKVVMLTAYDHPTAVLEQEAGVDSILVGDSLAQVLLGHGSTIHATMDLMIPLTAAVRRGAPQVFLIGDMPFLSYQVSDAEAIRNAGRFMTDAGCDCVKLECDVRHAGTVAALARAGIPVMTHIGLRPQLVHQLGGYRSQARDADAAQQLLATAMTLVDAGACALLIEAVPPEPARRVTEQAGVPVIGCGAGPHVDGHVVVLQDMIGWSRGPLPKFVPRYAEVGGTIGQAVRQFAADVRSGQYPQPEHCYTMTEGQAELLGGG